MGQITTPILASIERPTGLNTGFVGERAKESETDIETARTSSSGLEKEASQSPMDIGTPVSRSPDTSG